MIDNAWSIGERQHLTPDDRLWLGVALFWSYGCVKALFALMTHGGTIVLQHHFEPGEALRLIERERCTVFYGTAAMSRPMLEHPERLEPDLSSPDGTTIGTPERCNWSTRRARNLQCLWFVEAFGNLRVLRISHRAPFGQFRPALDGVEIRIADVDRCEY